MNNDKKNIPDTQWFDSMSRDSRKSRRKNGWKNTTHFCENHAKSQQFM